MAEAAGRRNILRELMCDSDCGVRNSADNTALVQTPPSPDETVIQLRGHHRKSATYNFGASDPVFFRTPTKSPKKMSVLLKLRSPTKSTPVRSSPRKHSSATHSKSNETLNSQSTIGKQMKLKKLQNFQPKVHLEKTVKALSYSQLVDLIADSMKISPDIEKIFNSLLPWPDLAPVEEKLTTLQRNAYKSYPRNIWGSQDSSFCYLRIRTHLEAFKKECLSLCCQFMESQHWPTVFEFILIALKITIKLPNWTTETHNKIKLTCLKQLGAHFLDALRKANLEHDALSELSERIKEFAELREMKAGIALVDELLAKNITL